MKGLICGVGINDADYIVSKKSNGVTVRCRYYSRWKDMIRRCYSERRGSEHAAYEGCSVCDEWKSFMSFRGWMQRQDWMNKHLDKDILIPGNKVYAPDLCVFVDDITNTFLTTGRPNGNGLLTGAVWDKSRGKFMATCGNPFSKKANNLGRFDTEIEAHNAWKKRKHQIACMLADVQRDERVAEALRSRYAD